MSATHIERRGSIAVVTLDSSPVNGPGVQARAGLDAPFPVEEGAIPPA